MNWNFFFYQNRLLKPSESFPIYDGRNHVRFAYVIWNNAEGRDFLSFDAVFRFIDLMAQAVSNNLYMQLNIILYSDWAWRRKQEFFVRVKKWQRAKKLSKKKFYDLDRVMFKRKNCSN